MRHSQCCHTLLPASPQVAPPAASAFPVGICPCVRSARQTAGGSLCGRRLVFISCGWSCGSYAILEHVASPHVCVCVCDPNTPSHIGRLARSHRGGGVGSLNVPRLGFMQTNQTTWLQISPVAACQSACRSYANVRSAAQQDIGVLLLLLRAIVVTVVVVVAVGCCYCLLLLLSQCRVCPSSNHNNAAGSLL